VTFLAPDQQRPIFDRNDPQQAAPQGNGQLDGSGYLNSGLLQNGTSYVVTASEPGTYSYVCLVHPQQVGTVVVNPAGTPYEHSQADYTAAVDAASPTIADWQARLAAYQPTMRQRPDGTREHVILGGMGDGTAAVMRFSSQALEIRAGDTVTWDNLDTEAPHVVMFGPVQGAPTEAWGDPRAFDGTDPLSSGYFGQNWPLGETYSVTFSTPGQLAYVCVLHAPALMIGTIAVAP